MCAIKVGGGGGALYPWKITSSLVPGISIKDFFFSTVEPKLPSSDAYSLEESYIGSSHDKLDRVDFSLPLGECIALFGHYLKYLVKVRGTLREATCANAFEVLMEAGRRQSSCAFLPDLKSENNGKDRLYNSIIHYLDEHNLKWSASEVPSYGKNFLKSLTDLLWYIDGQHDRFNNQSCLIPKVFQDFQGYNCPEMHGHRKRAAANFSHADLEAYSQAVYHCLLSDYWGRKNWKSFKPDVNLLLTTISKYVDGLEEHCKRMKAVHQSTLPVREVSDCVSYSLVAASTMVNSQLRKIDDIVKALSPLEPLLLNDHCPINARHRYNFLQLLKGGLSLPVVHLSYKAGNNVGDLHYIWHGDPNDTDVVLLEHSLAVVEKLQPSFPKYSTRAMRRAMFNKFGRIAPGIKPATLRCYYRELTGDCVSSCNAKEEVVDRRVKQLLDMEPEDPKTLADLADAESPERKTKFDVFWSECSKFLAEEVGQAVDDRRHDTVTHLAKAISIRDFLEQVKGRCPPDTLIPSQEWLRLQFWPKVPHTHAAIHHTGRLNVKFMVQQRQYRKDHEDSHYAAAIFRYEREYAVHFKEHSAFLCIDDKHRAKVGEPGYPVAAAERGRRVIVARGTSFQVGDHDFTKFSVVPSVVLNVDIPDSVAQSWYRGKVTVTLKEAALEPSSPFRHAAELSHLLAQDPKPILFLYSDGGPDHRLTYLSVQISLLALFRSLNLDYLCAARVAPYQSWRNPVERVMSTINMGMQCVGLMRKQGSDEYEAQVARCNSLADMRKAAEKYPNFREDTLDSMASVKVLLTDLFQRLQLKDEPFSVASAATIPDIEAICEFVTRIDTELDCTGSMRKSILSTHPVFKQFYDHCCRSRHYFFEIKKCGQPTCQFCLPINLPQEVFSRLQPFPDPTPSGVDAHYLPFDEVFGTSTSECSRPSLQKKPQRKKTLPFHGVLQHVKNVDMMLECTECDMWRLLYSKKKLAKCDRMELQRHLDEWEFTCGSQLQDLQLAGPLAEVYVREMSCYEPIEKLYYSAKYESICIFCARDQRVTDPKYYPQCENCKNREAIKRN